MGGMGVVGRIKERRKGKTKQDKTKKKQDKTTQHNARKKTRQHKTMQHKIKEWRDRKKDKQEFKSRRRHLRRTAVDDYEIRLVLCYREKL